MNFNPYLPTYSEFLTESSKEGFVSAVINAPTNIKMMGVAKGDEVQIDALQYTKGKDTDQIDCISNRGVKLQLKKSLLTVKF